MFPEPVHDPAHLGPDLLHVDVDSDDQISRRRVTVIGEMDMLSAATVHETVTSVLSRRPDQIEIDLRDVTFLDSAGIRTLVMCHADAGRVNCELTLVNPHPGVYDVLRITGLLGLFQLTGEP